MPWPSLTLPQALPIFSVGQTFLYLLLLLVADRKGRQNSVDLRERYSFKALTFIHLIEKLSLTLSAIGLTLTLLTSFRETALYFAILALVLLMSSIVAVSKSSGLVLGTLILWHLMMYLSKVPAVDISVGEGMEMVREMRLNDHWQFEWAHNRSYNPLPTIAFLQATLSRIIAINWYSYNLGLIRLLSLLVTYDLAMYALTYAISGDKRMAILSIPLIALTPETPIHQHPYQWSGNALVLIASAVLINVIKGRGRYVSNFISVLLLFTGAILAHATGSAFLFLLIFLLLTGNLAKIFPMKLERSTATSGIRPRLWHVLCILLIITVARSVHTYGYSEFMFPEVQSIFNGLVDLIKQLFIPSEEAEEAAHIPLYERAGVPWVQAYVWSYALSMATAYILRSLVRNKVDSTKLALYATSAFFLSAAYMGYGLLKIREFYCLNVTTYVFFPFIYPLAAEALTRIVEGLFSNRKLYVALALSGFILLTLAAPIAAGDPNISPIQYAKVRQSEVVTLDIGDFAEASFILKVNEIPSLYMFSYNVYRIGGYRLSYFNPTEKAIGLWYPVLTAKLKSAIELYSFLNKLRLPYIEVLTYSELEYANSNWDLIFNSQKDLVYVP